MFSLTHFDICDKVLEALKRCFAEDTMNRVCFFTGHRELDFNNLNEIKSNTEKCILNAIERGCTKFLAGGAIGFDMLAAETVLKLKKDYPISLKLALPYKNQQLNWSKKYRLKYEQLAAEADEVVYIAEQYDRGCFHRRNRYMADEADLCIAYFNGQAGGTFYTVKYAVSKDIEILFV